MPTIDTSSATIYWHPIAKISTATFLGDTWTEQKYVRLERLRMCCSPQVSQANLRYDYGLIQREDKVSATAYNPISLAGKFIKIEIIDTVLDVDSNPANSVVWHGIIQPDERHPDGTSGAGQASGQQYIVAFGLERMLEQQTLKSALIDIDGTTASLLTAQRGLPFNTDPDGDYPKRGNRSTNKVVTQPDPDLRSSYVFSWEPRESAEWDAYTATEYLLLNQVPLNPAGSQAVKWRIDGSASILNWYDISVETDGLNLKQILDKLIPRNRGVSYYVWYEETDDLGNPVNEVVLQPFTFVDRDVTLPSGAVIPKNPDRYALNFEQALDAGEVIVCNTATSLYHKVIARGARRTTTFTAKISNLPFNSNVILGPGWVDTDEIDYRLAASLAVDYPTLDTQEKQRRNSIYRKSERLRAVYSQFVLNAQKDITTRWNGKIPQSHQPDSTTTYWLVPDVSTDVIDPTAADATTGGLDWIPGVRFLHTLPLYEGYDYSGSNLSTFSYPAVFNGTQRSPAFLKPLVYGRTKFEVDSSGVETNNEFYARYEPLDRMRRPMLIPKNEQPRDWSVEIGVLSAAPGIELNTPVAHFLYGPTAGSGDNWATTADDERGDQHGAIPFTDIWCTLTAELNHHVMAEQDLTLPAIGAPVNVLTIEVPDARLDYVLPYTTVEIKDGKPVQTISGGAAKDDRKRLQSICRAAAEWYGKGRQTLQVSFRQIRELAELGWLITSIGANYSLLGINTPVTALTFEMGDGDSPGSTTIETGFAALDFSHDK